MNKTQPCTHPHFTVPALLCAAFLLAGCGQRVEPDPTIAMRVLPGPLVAVEAVPEPLPRFDP